MTMGESSTRRIVPGGAAVSDVERVAKDSGIAPISGSTAAGRGRVIFCLLVDTRLLFYRIFSARLSLSLAKKRSPRWGRASPVHPYAHTIDLLGT
jgi:hypothetical protein